MNTKTLGHDGHNSDSTDIFGFWMYIMTDCVLFATLFAAFAVLHNNTYGGPGIKQLVSLPYVFGETMFLLISNLTYGLGLLSVHKRNQKQLLGWLYVSIIFGVGFLTMELNEFIGIVREGHSWQSSAALSSFFTLVGTHGLHVFLGLVWMVVLSFQVTKLKINSTMVRRLTYLGLFWNFLDIVWIFVFTIVYLMGAI